MREVLKDKHVSRNGSDEKAHENQPARLMLAG